MAAQQTCMRNGLHAAVVECSSWSVKSLRSDIPSDVIVQSAMLGLKLAPSPTTGCYGSANICVKMTCHPQSWILSM